MKPENGALTTLWWETRISRVVRDSEPNLNYTIVYISHATEQPSVVTDATFATTEAPSTTASAFPPLPSSMHDSEPKLN